MAHIVNPPNNLLTSDTVIILSVTGGSATGRSMVIVVRNIIVFIVKNCCYILSLAVGQDFNLSQSEVTFELGTNDGKTKTVFVDVLDDLLVEGTESFTLSGSIGCPSTSGSESTSGQDSGSGIVGSPGVPEAVFVGGHVTVSIFDDEGK